MRDASVQAIGQVVDAQAIDVTDEHCVLEHIDDLAYSGIMGGARPVPLGGQFRA